MSLTRHNTLTMFRDRDLADTNAVFTVQNFDGKYGMHIDKVDDDTGEATSLFMLDSAQVGHLKDWAQYDGEAEIVVSGFEDAYQLKIAPSLKFPGGIKLLKCFNSGKKKTLLVLSDHQRKRLVDWLVRIK